MLRRATRTVTTLAAIGGLALAGAACETDDMGEDPAVDGAVDGGALDDGLGEEPAVDG